MTLVGEALLRVRERVAEAARAAGRAPEEVKLIAVSKGHSSHAIREAYEAGQRAFGESYAKELSEKARELHALRDMEWHFIGHLQSNKAKWVAKHASIFHALDKLSLAEELSRRIASEGRPPLGVLVEVNVSGEVQKHGIPPDDLPELLEKLSLLPGIQLKGLMTMPPAGDLDRAAHVFETLRSLQMQRGGPSVLPELSMGMSSDYERAVASGATMVRIGTAIFGERERRGVSNPNHT